MSRYGVVFLTTASTVMYVDADSADEAREKADDAFEAPYLCAQCSGWGDHQNLELGDFEADDSESSVFLV